MFLVLDQEYIAAQQYDYGLSGPEGRHRIIFGRKSGISLVLDYVGVLQAVVGLHRRELEVYGEMQSVQP